MPQEHAVQEKNDFTKGDMKGDILRLALPMIMAQITGPVFGKLVPDRVYGSSQSVGESCVGHYPSIIPPGAKLLSIADVGIPYP